MQRSTEIDGSRKMLDALVAGYLGRQKYWESLKCFMNESPVLRAAQFGGMSIILGDTVHGKHLEEIVVLFSEYGNFGLTPALLDFGLRLRSLANEFTSLTNAGAHWSDAQKLLYGKRAQPRSYTHHHMPTLSSMTNVDDGGTNQIMSCSTNAESSSSLATQCSNGSASTRRKCTQPVSKNTRRREFLKEVVEPVVHTAQQIIDSGSGNAIEPNSSVSSTSLITIDENALGTLERCMALENFSELIESIEKDLPDGFFDYFPTAEGMDNLHGPTFDAVPTNSNEAQAVEEHQQKEESQNLFDIPQANELDELSSSVLTLKSNTQEKSSVTVRKTDNPKMLPVNSKFRHADLKVQKKRPVVAESAIFTDRVEVECPYMPIEDKKKLEADGTIRNSSSVSEKSSKADNRSAEKGKANKPEKLENWKKLAELYDESHSKASRTEGQKVLHCNKNAEMCWPDRQTSNDFDSSKDSSMHIGDIDFAAKTRNEISNPSINSGDVAAQSNSNIIIRQQEKRVQDNGSGESTKQNKGSRLSAEWGIDSLFENSDDSQNFHILKGNELKDSDASLVSVRTSFATKDLEDREIEPEREFDGVENSVAGYSERQAAEVKSVADKKSERQKQKPINGSPPGDSKNLGLKKRKSALSANSLIRDSEQQGDASASGMLHTVSEQNKKEKFKKVEENSDETRTNSERRKKEREVIMKKEREEIERQKREVEEKELKRAAERERRRKEEEQREVREREEREKRRRERENREKLKKAKEKEEKLKSNECVKTQWGRSKDEKLTKESKINFRSDIRNDDSSDASILDKLFGDENGLKVEMKSSDKDESRRKPDETSLRVSSTQKPHMKAKPVKEDCHIKKEKTDRGVDFKTGRNAKDSSSVRPDALDDLFNCLASKPSTSRKEEMDIMETKPYRKVVKSGVSKGRENLLVGGGHSARVGMVLEKATRIRTKLEHDEKMRQEYRKLESVRRVTTPLKQGARKRILDLPIPKTLDLLSQIPKPSLSHNDSVRRCLSTKDISNDIESTQALLGNLSKSVPVTSPMEKKSYGEGSAICSHGNQTKKPRLDMAAIDAVLQSLHGLEKASCSSSTSLPATSSASISEQKFI